MNDLTNNNFHFVRIDIEHIDGNQEFRFQRHDKLDRETYVTFKVKRIGYYETETDTYENEDAEKFLNTLLDTGFWKVTNRLVL